jgi:hypothetical protein
MGEKLRFLGMDVHAKTIAVAVAEPDAVIHASRERGMSERRACQLVNQPHGTQRYQPTQREDEDALTRG